MVIFIIYLGQAFQCVLGSKCVPVPYDGVASIIQFGFAELLLEVGTVKFFISKRKKDDDG